LDARPRGARAAILPLVVEIEIAVFERLAEELHVLEVRVRVDVCDAAPALVRAPSERDVHVGVRREGAVDLEEAGVLLEVEEREEVAYREAARGRDAVE